MEEKKQAKAHEDFTIEVDKNTLEHLIEAENKKEKKREPKTHEEFMREVSKQTLKHLIEVENNIKAIKGWVTFFGVMSLIGGVLWLIIVVLSSLSF